MGDVYILTRQLRYVVAQGNDEGRLATHNKDEESFRHLNWRGGWSYRISVLVQV